ncbi:ABC transporter substrate-binding protein [Candidatus Woesearchaeota archaeon]|jgi:ABC-type nitrate/sulfonate/bicarbonate transport system substrate-binding protein|nr:ABC transporter substrate-binding protein [Candidatus Woesearchaeota archaeon]
MKKIITIMLVLLTILTTILISGCTVDTVDTAPLEKITITEGQQPIGALVYIAFENGYFTEQGLEVIFQNHFSGKSGLNAVLEGKADIANVANTPIGFNVLKGNDVSIISTIGTSTKAIAVLALKDKGISVPSDLKNKKIGVTLGTNGEFFLNVFLTVHGLTINEVELVNTAPTEMYNELLEGRVDAVSAWNPHIGTIQSGFGDKVITFFDEDIYTLSWNLAGTSEFVNNNPEKIEKITRALVKAEEFVKNNPAEAITLVANFLQLDEEKLKEDWTTYSIEATLKQTLLLGLEDQSRWAIENNLTDAKEIPNYLDYIYMDALEKVKPEAVTIIR